MEHRLTFFAIGDVHGKVLILENYPPVYGALSNANVLEDQFIRTTDSVHSTMSVAATIGTKADEIGVNTMLNECNADLKNIQENATASALNMLKRLPSVQPLGISGTRAKWQCTVPYTQPLTAYGYVINDGTVFDIPLADVPDIECNVSGKTLTLVINDPDYIAITVESTEQMWLAVAPLE